MGRYYNDYTGSNLTHWNILGVGGASRDIGVIYYGSIMRVAPTIRFGNVQHFNDGWTSTPHENISTPRIETIGFNLRVSLSPPLNPPLPSGNTIMAIRYTADSRL